MLVTGLVTVGIVSCLLFLVVYLTRRAYEREKARFFNSIKLYFESPDDKTPSEFAVLIDTLADRFADKMLNKFKTSFMGQQSVDSRNLDRLKTDMVQDGLTAQNPLIGALASQFPAVSRRLAKNPNLLPMFQGFLSNLGRPDGNRGGNSKSGSYANRLNKYKGG